MVSLTLLKYSNALMVCDDDRVDHEYIYKDGTS